MNTSLLVTTSWDDGHRLDLDLADLLDRHGLTGTFYIAPRSVELAPHDRMRADHIRSVASRFEIGGHTLTHRALPSLTLSEARQEICNGKEELESIVGTPLHSFCYPRGEYDERHVQLVREAGFRVGRTVRRWVVASPLDLFQLDTTVHAYRHLKDLPRFAVRPRLAWATRRSCFWNWDVLAIALFDQALKSGGVFHLWGHSWEIAAHQDWQRLDAVLRYIGGRTDVSYVTNGALSSTADPSSPAPFSPG